MRIITGKARGTSLFTPKNYAVRPTADRVKESIFNILAGEFADARVLDAFAGTGNLGLEAWSRGAAEVTFVDRSRESLSLVRRNMEKCRAGGQCELWQGDVLEVVRRLAASGRQYDCVFMDPPYRKNLVSSLLAALATVGIVRTGGFVVAERGADEGALPPAEGFELWRTEKYGSTVIDFLRKL